MSDDTPPIDLKVLEEMNEKAVRNQFFTPDRVYLDMSLMKDFALGAVYADMLLKGSSEIEFKAFQDKVLNIVHAYQKRTYETINPYLGPLGYTDEIVAALLKDPTKHDLIFALAPTTKFFPMLIRHTIRNQNNSRPASKYTKRMISKDEYVMDPIPVTYRINTYPLQLSKRLLTSLATELGESLGVNIAFISKSVAEFNHTDWDEWINITDCFYLNSIGTFTRNPYLASRQEELELVGRFFFARKRFETCVIDQMQGEDFDQQIQMATATLDMFCDFAWIQNNDTRLTQEAEDVPMDEPQTEQERGAKS